VETLDNVGLWSAQVLLVGLSVTRIAVAFLLLPPFSSDMLPPLVRNALFVALAVLTVAMQPAADVVAFRALDWLRLFGKEIFIGSVIGLLFGAVLWAFEIAGQVIDMKTGAALAQVIDPLSGHQTPLTAALLSRLAMFVFMSSGGFLLLVELLMQSFATWPVTSSVPMPRAGTVVILETGFGRISALGLLVSAPFLVVLYVVEGTFGLVNRYAPQLNVFALSGAIKLLAAQALLAMLLMSLGQLVVDETASTPATVLKALHAILRTGS